MEEGWEENKIHPSQKEAPAPVLPQPAAATPPPTQAQQEAGVAQQAIAIAAAVAATIHMTPTEELPSPLTLQDFDPDTMLYVARFDFEMMDNAVCNNNNNPHFAHTCAGGAVELPLPPHPPFPEVVFVHTHIVDHRLKSNMDPLQAEAVRKAGLLALTLIVHGGRQLLYRESGEEIAAALQKYVRGFAFQSNNGLGSNVTVYPPLINKPDDKPFSSPIAMLARLLSGAEVLRTFLTQQEVFCVSPTLSFSATSFGILKATWKVLVLTGSTIDPSVTHRYVVNQKATILQAIKDMLAGHKCATQFETITAQLAWANWGLTGTRRAVVDAALDTFTLILSSAKDRSGATVPAYILAAKPPAYDQYELEQWRVTIAGWKAIWIRMDRFNVNAAKVECKLCKSDIHCTSSCVIATEDEWVGVTPDSLATADPEERPGGGPSNVSLDASMRELFRSAGKKNKTTRRGGLGGLGGPSNRGGSRGGGRGGRCGGRGAWGSHGGRGGGVWA
ncbi:hypothetical protein C8Q80DRAFT_1116623 [Daedaleopsis nitida]|nr:hypothetical protein C8Q80DRAFT_1116623 [Daedaleopsis nitida]